MASGISRPEAVSALHTAMDGRALNLTQTRLIFDPSPEVDSLSELVASLLPRGVDADVVAELTGLCRRLLESNFEEGRCHMDVAAMMEDHIARQLATTVADRATIKSLAARLRGPLGVIDDQLRGTDRDGIAYFRACCAVRDVISTVPAERLLTAAMRHELRGRRFDLLTDLVEASR